MIGLIGPFLPKCPAEKLKRVFLILNIVNLRKFHFFSILKPLSIDAKLILNTDINLDKKIRRPKYSMSMTVGDLKLALTRSQFVSGKLLMDSWSTVKTKAQVANVFARYRTFR